MLDIGNQLLQGELGLAVTTGQEVSPGQVSPTASWQILMRGLRTKVKFYAALHLAALAGGNFFVASELRQKNFNKFKLKCF